MCAFGNPALEFDLAAPAILDTRKCYRLMGGLRRIFRRHSTPEETRFVYGGQGNWQVLEEQDELGVLQAEYAHGRYIDETLRMWRDYDSDGTVEEITLLGDEQHSTTAVLVTGEAGVQERFAFEDYGEPSFLDGAGASTTATSSAVGNPYLFQGRRYDAETGYYQFRYRYLDPSVGKFTARDPIGIWGDSSQLGNGTSFEGGNPWSRLDSSGLNATSVASIVIGKAAVLTTPVVLLGVGPSVTGSISGNNAGQNQSSSSWQGAATGIGLQVAHDSHLRLTDYATLDSDPKMSSYERQELRKSTKARLSPLGKVLTPSRPDLVNPSRIPGTKGASSQGWNKLAKLGRAGGVVSAGLGLIVSSCNIANAPEGEKLSTATKEGGKALGGAIGSVGGAWAGVWAGAKLGAAGGSWAGPAGAILGGIGGGLFGAWAGNKLTGGIVD